MPNERDGGMARIGGEMGLVGELVKWLCEVRIIGDGVRGQRGSPRGETAKKDGEKD